MEKLPLLTTVYNTFQVGWNHETEEGTVFWHHTSWNRRILDLGWRHTAKALWKKEVGIELRESSKTALQVILS